jgi:type II secretory pathway component PulF
MNSMGNNEQILFLKRLSFLTKAGLGVGESLNIIKDQTKSNNFKVIESLITDTKEGKKLSKSLSKFPKLFNDFVINIIDFSESSGTLSQNLDYIVDELLKRKNIKKKIISSLVYPAIIGIVTLSITIFLITYLFPKITPIFKNMNMEIPITTKTIMFISQFISNYWIYCTILILAITTTLFYLLKNNHRFKFIVANYIFRMPQIGKIFIKYNIANLTRTLAVLIYSGIPINEALRITHSATRNLVYKNELTNIITSSEKGEQISSYTKNNPSLFPHEVSAIISSGEKSGNLAESFIYISRAYEIEIDDLTKNINNIIEPLMMIFVGLIIGFISISIISPIYNITSNLQK